MAINKDSRLQYLSVVENRNVDDDTPQFVVEQSGELCEVGDSFEAMAGNAPVRDFQRTA